ncbi:MAG: DUF3570 domain-containing protein [Methyloglobulus sp.]
MKNDKKSNIAAKLTFAALALPGLVQTVSAGRVEETYNADFQYGNYQEGDGRMGVDIFEGAFSVPIGKSMTANVNVIRDSISGASPIKNQRDVNGNTVQVKSGASGVALSSECGKSICEERDAASAGLTYFFDEASLNLGGGFSRENDYTSRYFNTATSWDLNKKLTTLNFGASVAFDEVEPTNFNLDCGDKCSKTSQQYLLGVSQVIDKDSLIQSNMTFGYHNGYLTDPYKKVQFYGNFDYGGGFVAPTGPEGTELLEKRPEERFEWAWLTQYVRHFEQFNHAALHADYRFSTNDWGINAHTVEFSWHQPIADGWQVIPRFRYYSQDKADFYQPVFDGDVGFDSNFNTVAKNLNAYSSDYRLAGFGTISGGLKLSKEINNLQPFTQLKFQTGFEYYARKAEYQLGGNSQGDFADYGYYLITAGFNLKF